MQVVAPEDHVSIDHYERGGPVHGHRGHARAWLQKLDRLLRATKLRRLHAPAPKALVLKNRARAKRNGSGGTAPQDSFEALAVRKWTELLHELERDVEEFRRLDGHADFKKISDLQARISNPPTGVAVVLTADMAARTIQYNFQPEHKNTAVPDGGFLALRSSSNSGVELYSADQQLTSELARQLILEPLLFPATPMPMRIEEPRT